MYDRTYAPDHVNEGTDSSESYLTFEVSWEDVHPLYHDLVQASILRVQVVDVEHVFLANFL